MLTTLSIAAGSYLLGSIPFGYLLVRIFRGEDVRKSGSGNIGATNVSRKSPALGISTLLLDAMKGAGAALLASHLIAAPDAVNRPYNAMSMAAFFAVFGHIFPVWLKFRGGKGVATALGSFVVITPKAVFVAIGIFAVLVLLFRYVSLASILAVGSFPLLLIRSLPAQDNASVALGWISATSLLIVGRHHQNIRRLFLGTEPRIGAKSA